MIKKKSLSFFQVKKIIKGFLFKIELIFATLVFNFFFRSNRNCILTCSRSDGGGAQIHGRFSVISFANYFGVRFLNSPIINAHFGNGKDWDTVDAGWDLKWNSLIKFENLTKGDLEGAKVIKTATSTDLWKIILKIIITAKVNNKYIFELESAHRFTDLKPIIIDKSRELFRRMLVRVPLQANENIVIHLRRGNDVTAKIRYEKDEILFKWLGNILEKYPKNLIRIYTNELFELPIQFQNLVIVDNKSTPFEAITHMADCKILVIAKSSMSYIAALMNQGVVYCPNFWHPKMKDWVYISKLESKY